MIFGRFKARTHSIEFQKRGFPHVHLIVWLDRDAHFSPNDVDEIICAEIPDERLQDGTDNPLHGIVKQFMLHGPCGEGWNCCKEGRCKNGFPKPYQSETALSEDAYPLYRRCDPQEGGNSLRKWKDGKLLTYTNADVVAYNPYLLFRYNCHINVEFINSINALKYHIKYIYKGPDSATVTVDGIEPQTNKSTGEENQQQDDEKPRNEVNDFKHERYIAGAEACHRAQGNELAAREPGVLRLQVHLPGQQTVCFDANDKDGSIERIEKAERTHLIVFFDLNKKDAFARTQLYRNIPRHYTWQAKERRWKRRVRGAPNEDINMPNMIGRVYSIHPTHIELYALRLLLNHVRGATSYEHLRTVTVNSETTTHNTFQAAAVARDLVNNDNMWIECMQEADQTETNIYRLRRLFVTILRECHLGDHKSFYDKCKEMLSADFRYKYKHEFEDHPLLGQKMYVHMTRMVMKTIGQWKSLH